MGVIALPEVTEYLLTAEDEFLVLASDGVWEFIDNQEVGESRKLLRGRASKAVDERFRHAHPSLRTVQRKQFRNVHMRYPTCTRSNLPKEDE